MIVLYISNIKDFLFFYIFNKESSWYVVNYFNSIFITVVPIWLNVKWKVAIKDLITESRQHVPFSPNECSVSEINPDKIIFKS